jgi:hypothetical protein
VDVIDFELVGIAWLRIFEALLVVVCLATGQWIRQEARDAGWSLARCRAITAITWLIALVSVGGFVWNALSLEIGGLLAILFTFLASGPMAKAIAEHPSSRRVGLEPGGGLPATGGQSTSNGAPVSGAVDRWLALVAGVVLGGSAFYGRSVLLGADILILGWLASRRPIPVVWTSLLGVAAGIVGGGLVTVDPARVTIAVLAMGILCLAWVLRRVARGADGPATLPTAGP